MIRPTNRLAWVLMLLGAIGLLQGCCPPEEIPSATTVVQTQPQTTAEETTVAQTQPTTQVAEEITKPTQPVTQETEAATKPTQPATVPTTPAPPVTEQTQIPTQPVTQPTPEIDPVGLQQEAEVLPEAQAAVTNLSTVSAPGTRVKEGGGACIDYSNTDDGYVMIRYTGESQQRLKVQVKGPASTYTYNLPQGQWEAFPLSDENGQYQVTVYINVVDSKYAVLLSEMIEVDMEDEFEPFLRSNQYVNFDAAPNTVAQAVALAGGMANPLDKVSAVYHYVTGTISYDTALAATVTSGYLPQLDSVLARKSGICFDYAALMTGMLRSQGVPTKLVVGYAGSAYHAWINVWSESTGWVDGVIYFDGTSWKRMDPTFAASGGAGILDYIGDGTNYSAKYFY